MKYDVLTPKSKIPVKYKATDEKDIIASSINSYIEPENPDVIVLDGPPYANGNIHIGHALNKLSKDIMVKMESMNKTVSYQAGWDCHGLPIEWAVEQNMRKKKVNRGDIPDEQFRQKCREYAQSWVDTQKEEFISLGVSADWDNYYSTMSPEFEYNVVKTLHDISDRLYEANKPVMWSHVEHTAMASAEKVDQEHDIETIWVKYKLEDNIYALVWTTTPWSLMGGEAVSFSDNLSYGLYEHDDGNQYAILDHQAEKLSLGNRKRDFYPADYNEAEHPFYGMIPLIKSDTIKENIGTGFVHVGPSHSTEDWALWKQHFGDKSFREPINDKCQFEDNVPMFSGVSVVKGKKYGPANEMIIEQLRNDGNLYYSETQKITLSHSWRSGALLIERSTRQWFIKVDDVIPSLVDDLDLVEFNTKASKTRLVSMLHGRPDWLISRQRSWGSPLALVVNKQTRKINKDALPKIREVINKSGIEGWFSSDVSMFVDDPESHEKVNDVLDVWFDSACVMTQVKELPNERLYMIEGSDQSRGWFQSSLLLNHMSKNSFPLDMISIHTHGFVLDKNQRKMSKSENNITKPMDVINKFGSSDILRLWVASSDTTKDISVSDEVMKTHQETFRKIRNTLRFMEGCLNINGLDSEFSSESLTQIDQLMIEKVYRLKDDIDNCSSNSKYVSKVKNFVEELSSFYFELCKDIVYCDDEMSTRRQSILFTYKVILNVLKEVIHPIMPMVSSELHMALGGDDSSLNSLSDIVRLEVDIEVWDQRIKKREEVNVYLGNNKGELSNSQIELTYPLDGLFDSVDFDLKDFFLVAAINDGEKSITEYKGYKCERCWQYTTKEQLCERCEEVVAVI